jgi:glycosyltransferase involved in cell wall biosynthesis
MSRRFHVFGLAHQPVNGLVTSCAYTAKVRNMCIMLGRAGHEVHLYHAGSMLDSMDGLPIAGHQVVSDATLESTYGRKFYETYNQQWEEDDRPWQEFRRRAGMLIGRHLSDKGDIVLASFGTAHQGCCPPSAAAMVVEMGVGYEGIFAKRKVWESYAWRHFMYGRRPQLDPSFDVVIPGYYCARDFQLREGDGEHLLFLGRVREDKGVLEAYQAAVAAGSKLVIAGPGDPKWIEENMPEAEYVGMVGPMERSRLLSRATALICYTKYIEPFGNVAIEAMASGVPVISSDWGAFTETVIPGQTGYRCSSVGQIAASIIKIRDEKRISSSICVSFASNFELASVWPRYENYFETQHAIFKR